jgi:hypothetical protein
MDPSIPIDSIVHHGMHLMYLMRNTMVNQIMATQECKPTLPGNSRADSLPDSHAKVADVKREESFAKLDLGVL